MPASLADRILVAADVLILGVVAAAGMAGDRIPLPRGQDAVDFSRPAPPDPTGKAMAQHPPASPEEPRMAAPLRPESAPATPPKPGQAEWNLVYAARERGLTAMNLAREAKPTEPDKKRQGYDAAKKAFKEALEAIKAWRTCEGVDASMVDQQDREIRSFIFECDKFRPR